MKNFLIAFLVFLLWTFFGMWYYSCIVKGLCPESIFDYKSEIEELKLEAEEDARKKQALERKKIEDSLIVVEKAALEKARIDTLLKKDGFQAVDTSTKDTIFNFSRDVVIFKGKSRVFIPRANNRFNTLIANYFKSHPNSELIIYGAYNIDEALKSQTADSIGLARAYYVKERLVRGGLNPDRIQVQSTSQDIVFNAQGRYNGGVGMEFKPLSKSRLADVEAGISNKILYAGFAQETFRPDATLYNYAQELVDYLKKYPNKSVTVIGHTDNIGNDIDNKWIGMQRAKSVRRYLISRGVSSDKISASSQGEFKPLAANTSEVNRAKNRRIEIKVN